MPDDFDRILVAYVTCALWSSADEDETPLDDPDAGYELSTEAGETMAEDVREFLALCEREGVDLSTLEPEAVGHDLWLTRNHHGAGFWDRGLGELGKRLTALAESVGERVLFVGGDGEVYAL